MYAVCPVVEDVLRLFHQKLQARLQPCSDYAGGGDGSFSGEFLQRLLVTPPARAKPGMSTGKQVSCQVRS